MGQKSSRRESRSKSFSTPSKQPTAKAKSDSEAQRPTAPTSFLFVVNELVCNENFQQADNFGRWLPPQQPGGYASQVVGRIYRWTDGDVSIAQGYRWENRRAYTPGNAELVIHDYMTTFYCNNFLRFLTAPGDATTRNFATADVPNDRWYTLSFDNNSSPIARLDYTASDGYMEGYGSTGTFVDELGIGPYMDNEAEPQDPPLDGLAGKLAMLIALIAFSCRPGDLHQVLTHDRAWRHRRWAGHPRNHGRK